MLELLKTDTGKICISFILGLGLAAIFRQSCMGDNCVIIQGEPINNYNANTPIKIGDKCYTVERQETKCAE